MKDKVANQLVKYLEERGVEYVFGLCGHTNIAVLSALEKSKINFVNTRHEQVAAHAADGYARAKNQTAVVLSHLGPGPDQRGDRAWPTPRSIPMPMVVIAGDIPTHYYGKHPHQEVNLHADASQFEIYRPFVKRAWRVERPDLFPEIIEKAFSLAESGRPGPVLVDVPMDIFSAEVDVALFERLRAQHQEAAQAVARRGDGDGDRQGLRQAKRPLLYVGGGVVLRRRRRRAARLRRPSAGSGGAHADGQGRAAGRPSVRARHDRLLGHQVHQRPVPHGRLDPGPRHALLGGRLQLVGAGVHVQHAADQADPDRHRPVRDRPQLPGRDRRGRRPEAGAGGAQPRGAQAAARTASSDRSSPRRSPPTASEFVAGNRAHAQSNAYPMRPERILADVREVLPRDAFITTDVGWNKNGVGQQFPILRARARSSRPAATRRWASARRRRWARSSPGPTGWSSRWSATAASARTRRCSPPRSSRTSPWSG